jgi:hypothetical protein
MPEKRTRGSPETVAVTLGISLISCARRRRDEPIAKGVRRIGTDQTSHGKASICANLTVGHTSYSFCGGISPPFDIVRATTLGF